MTQLTDSSAAWTEDELVGLFVQPDTTSALRYVVVANSTNAVFLYGDLTEQVFTDDNYQIFDLHLDDGSQCIDSANGDEATSSDIEGIPRVDDPDASNGVGDPPYVDMGAFEHL